MRYFAFCLLPFALCFVSCRPAATPVSISNRPVSINDVPQTNLPLPPTKNVGNLGWQTFAGESEKLADLKGKVVVLDFWATYCPPCLEEIPHLNELHNKYGKNLQIVGLHVGGDEDRPKVPGFVKKLKINYPLATPEDELISVLFGSDDAIPQTFVFDRQGKLVKKIVGFDEIEKENLNDAILQALNEN